MGQRNEPGSRLDPSVIAQSLQGGQPGEGALADAEHLVTRFDPTYILADRLHDPREVHAGDGDLGCTESVSEEAKQVRHALHEVPHAPIHARRPDSHENLAVSDLGPFDVPEFEDVGWAVFFLDDRFRCVSPFFDVAICLR
jgi:hypothetical protein